MNDFAPGEKTSAARQEKKDSTADSAENVDTALVQAALV